MVSPVEAGPVNFNRCANSQLVLRTNFQLPSLESLLQRMTMTTIMIMITGNPTRQVAYCSRLCNTNVQDSTCTLSLICSNAGRWRRRQEANNQHFLPLQVHPKIHGMAPAGPDRLDSAQVLNIGYSGVQNGHTTYLTS